jgi:hypothetical protein
VNVGGGGERSRRMRLCDGFSVERRVAVDRPMPDEEPVIRIVLGVVRRELRVEGEGLKSVIFFLVKRRFVRMIVVKGSGVWIDWGRGICAAWCCAVWFVRWGWVD